MSNDYYGNEGNYSDIELNHTKQGKVKLAFIKMLVSFTNISEAGAATKLAQRKPSLGNDSAFTLLEKDHFGCALEDLIETIVWHKGESMAKKGLFLIHQIRNNKTTEESLEETLTSFANYYKKNT
jgi:hypothetical protein